MLTTINKIFSANPLIAGFFTILAPLEPKSKSKLMIKNLLAKAIIVTTTQLTIILIAVASIFLIFILIAIVKMYKLKAENKKLMDTNAFKDYEDSNEEEISGHLYGDN